MPIIIYTLLVTHITIICVTIYLHRGQAHKGLIFHPILEHFMRFWLWLTTGMVTKQWVAIHRKHHRYSDVAGDPHSPQVFGIWNVLFKGAALYHEASKDKDMVNTYGVGTPDDWLEHNIYSTHSRLGVSILLLFSIWLWGWIGALVWLIQMLWIPFWAAGVVNGLGHYFGYRNGESKDYSKNISPFGIIIGGEELHNNHHLNPASPRLSRRWFELDMGWIYIQFFRMIGLLKLRNTP
jgi:stearoyl-CoA desaturase (delta-9 desaturase)